MAIAAGAWALGLVADMPSGPGPIPDDAIAEIARAVPADVGTFLLTSRVEADGIIEHHHQCRTTALQLVDRVPSGDLQRVRTALPGVRAVQVVHVTGPDSVSEAQDGAGLVDMVWLDSGQPQAELRTLGGTQRLASHSPRRAIRR
jgi:phosphoribosylanthranilate isomerase